MICCNCILRRENLLWLRNILMILKLNRFFISLYYTIVTCNWFLYKQLSYERGKRTKVHEFFAIRSLEMQHFKLLIKSRIFVACSSLVEVPQRPDTSDISNTQLYVASVHSISFLWHFAELFVIGFRTPDEAMLWPPPSCEFPQQRIYWRDC